MYPTAHVDIPISQDKSGSKKVHTAMDFFMYTKIIISHSRHQRGS